MGSRPSSKRALAANANTSPTFVKRTLTTVFVALLIDILAFTIILPLYPRILEHYDKVDGADKSSLYYQMRTLIQQFRIFLGVPGARFDIVLFGGALGSMFSFLQFISSPVIGRMSDGYGRRTVLLTSMFGNGLSMLLWIFSESFGVFVCSRIVGGLTEGNVQMSIAVISDITTPETRSKGLALVGIAFSLGFTVGPPLGAYFTSINLVQVFPFLSGLPINQYSGPALFAFILIVIETVYLAIALPETEGYKASLTEAGTSVSSDDEGSPARRSTRIASKSASNLASPPPSGTLRPKVASVSSQLTILSAIHFLFLFFFSGMEFTLTFLTHDRFGYSHAQQGKFLAFIGVLSACVQGGYTRRTKTPTHRLAAQGILSAGVGLGVLGLAPHTTAWLYVGAAFLAVTSGTVVTALTSLASLEGRRTGQGEGEVGGDKGRVLGGFRAVGQLGRSLGPLFACSLYWGMGSGIAYGAGAAAMVAIAATTVASVRGPAAVPIVTRPKRL
ncbi:hypothetical protein HKX48_005074 [Thoreauomyces humboldtii]|nr:hypothetical protein HKX48_005074 [Thoreauomyces humboldtii]